MAEDNASTSYKEAQAMLNAFASVGATSFDVTRTTSAGDKDFFRRGVSLTDLARTLPGMIDAATAEQRNVIIRPHGRSVSFIQLDDLAADRLPRIAPAVFLALETSPGNFQAWLAMRGGEDKDFARRVRKGTGADATASGATRVSGSLNFKDKYAPNFPRVAIRFAHQGRMTTTAELEQLGLVAPPEELPPSTSAPARAIPGSNRKWPSYAHCLEGAPRSQSNPGQPRRSIADFTWCMIAADWGWPVDAIARQLLEESAKARNNGPTYALQTATRATEAAQRNAERRKQQPRGRIATHGRG
jgi:RepB DNA-primase from phage plasmid